MQRHMCAHLTRVGSSIQGSSTAGFPLVDALDQARQLPHAGTPLQDLGATRIALHDGDMNSV